MEVGHEVGSRDEVRSVAGFRGGDAQGGGEMRLAHTGRSKEENVAFLLHESQRGELGHHGAVEGRLEVEVESASVLWMG